MRLFPLSLSNPTLKMFTSCSVFCDVQLCTCALECHLSRAELRAMFSLKAAAPHCDGRRRNETRKYLNVEAFHRLGVSCKINSSLSHKRFISQVSEN